MIGIYLITNKINGHCYVGQSIDIKRRWRDHRKSIEQDAPLYLAFRKYGIDNFEFSVLEECQPEELNDKEIYYIEKFNSYYNGYNQTLGGSQYSHNVKITDDDYNKIIELLQYSEYTQKEIAEMFCVGQDTISEINTGKSRYNSSLQYPLRKNKDKHTCIDCGAIISIGAIRCQNCNASTRRKVERPTKEELFIELKNSNFLAVGRKYGVSDNAVRKWCKAYGLPTKSSAYK